MATVDANIKAWSNWDDNGDRWSERWGGPESQWRRTILPRIHRFIPAQYAVEIGCGHGRWTQFLEDECDELHAYDVADACLLYCERQDPLRRVRFHVTDGRSLPGMYANRLNFIFSFDSLVHADAPEMQGYIAEFARVLAPDGVAFIHHSNMADHPGREHMWRSANVSASNVRMWCEPHDLVCITQELVSWDSGDLLSDAFSLIVRKGSRWDTRPPLLISNADFPKEMDAAKRQAMGYDL